ncbi:MAG: DNA-binding domain-containing protein [Gammaproteobacteria bacterium]|jgi:hypothetical protein
MSLATLQQAFQDYLLTGDATPLGDNILPSRRLDAASRLQIYGEAYVLRLLEVLGNDYPRLKKLLGEDRFAELAQAYIHTHPSRHYSVRWFGRHLPDWLRHVEQTRSEPWLAELAAFEWAQGDAFDAPDAPLLGIQDLAAVTPEDWGALRFTPHPALRRLDLYSNTPELWRSLDEADAYCPPRLEDETTPWLIWRHDLGVRYDTLAEDAAWALDALSDGTGFGDLCAGLCDWVDEEQAPMHAAGLLKGWIEAGLLSGLEVRPD